MTGRRLAVLALRQILDDLMPIAAGWVTAALAVALVNLVRFDRTVQDISYLLGLGGVLIFIASLGIERRKRRPHQIGPHDPAAEYLVWSHDPGIWCKPRWAGYTDYITLAGRFTLADAQNRAYTRLWPASQTLPPEVVVPAPSAELLSSPDLHQVMTDRISAATAAAITARVGRSPR